MSYKMFAFRDEGATACRLEPPQAAGRPGRSQEDLSLDAEIDRSYMSRLERGVVNPTVGVLEQIADALDAHISEFFVEPAKGERAPKPLRGGRRRRL